MPRRKERAAIYVRESDITLAMDSTTVESAIKALLEHAAKEGYEVDPSHIYKEAISGYSVYYFDRQELMKMLKEAEHKTFDVLLVTEIRALSRRGAGEVLVIYNSLQKANVRLETLNEKITDDPMGEVLLSFRASWARIEREQSFLRLQRGKKDRIEIGQAPPNGHRCYGFILVDTEKEVKGRYEFNREIIYRDADGVAWSEYKARKFILDLLKEGETLHGTANRLNDIGVPPPRKSKKGTGCWTATAIQRIAESRMNIGEVWVNKYKKVKNEQSRKGTMVLRPQAEWILLPAGTVPALIDEETFDAILRHIKHNRQDSLRNNQHTDELGLLRSGYIFCGICGRRMILKYPSERTVRLNGNTAVYRCQQKEGQTVDITHNHRTQIHVPGIDAVARQKIVEVLLRPEVVRAKVEAIRQANKRVIDPVRIEETIENIRRSMQNLYRLAESATDDETIAHLADRMNTFERQKRDAEAMLFELEGDEEERAEIEKELQKFERWVERVRPSLTDPTYMACYDELRLAIRILGIRVTVYPTVGDWPFRYQVDVTVPEVLAKVTIVSQTTAGLRKHWDIRVGRV